MHGPEVAAPARPAVEAVAGGGYGELVLTSLVVLVLVCGVAWVALRVLGRWLEGRRVVARGPGGVGEPQERRRLVGIGAERLLERVARELLVAELVEDEGAELAESPPALPHEAALEREAVR